MEESYEDLAGGRGRSVFFRPRRYRPHSLVREMPLELQVGNEQVNLYDLSTNGLSFDLANARPAPTPGTVLPIRLSVRNLKAFSGRGRVVRTQGNSRNTRVAVRLLGDLIEPAELKALHDKLAFQKSMEQGIGVFDAVPKTYRNACADATLFLNHWRSLLDRRQQEILGSRQTDAREALRRVETTAEPRMREEWREIRQRVNEIVPDAYESDAAFLATKRFTELQVTALTLVSPIWQRAYAKPLGYPGDYRLMNYMYDTKREGDTAFARIFHQLGREEPLAATVETRKATLLHYIHEAVKRSRDEPHTPVRITSLGAGPAREVEDYLHEHTPGARLVFSLVDQDADALAFANERVGRAALRHADRVEVNCRYVSFKQLLGRQELIDELKDQNLIYSAGLLDYLPASVARALVAQLFPLLGADGLLVLGNASDVPAVTWVPEFVLDWHMTYRTRADLMALARDLVGVAKIDVEEDHSGMWNFLIVRRGAPR